MSKAFQDPAQVLSAFIAFEESEHLFERKLFGVAYWQLIRQDVFRETLEALGLAARAHLRLEDLPLRHWLGPQLRRLPDTVQRSLLAGLPQAELLVATHPRHLLHRGQYICPYAQPLLWGTGRSRVLITGQYQGRYFRPDAGEITRYVDLGLVRSHASFQLRELFGMGMSAAQVGELAEIRERLAARLSTALSAAALIRRARTAVLSSLGLSPWLDELLARVQPRLLVTVVGYRLVHQLLTLCARAQNIPVAELQHGTIGAAHAGYTFAKGRKPPAFPDALLTFGEIWPELTPGLPLAGTDVHAVGYGWLDLQRDAHPRTAAGKRRILFLSQRDIGRELARWAAEAAQALPRDQFEVVYRLHPSEAVGGTNAYPELARAGIHVETAQARPLYAAQADSDVQVGVYSTALVEGIAFGVATCIAALPGHKQLSFLVERGLARLVQDAGELTTALRDAQAPPDPSAGTALWAPNPPQRFAAFVEHTLSTDAVATHTVL